MARKPKPKPPCIDFPSFPPEIRNRIKDYILRPGSIHPPYTRNGIQILAANRESYEVGHLIFYADNMFHIPPGIRDKWILKQYQPSHLRLVRRVTLTCSFSDLDLCVFKEGFEYRQADQKAGHRRHVGCRYVDNGTCAGKLQRIWINKILDIPHYFPNIEELRFEFPDVDPRHVLAAFKGQLPSLMLEVTEALDATGEDGNPAILFKGRDVTKLLFGLRNYHNMNDALHLMMKAEAQALDQIMMEMCEELRGWTIRGWKGFAAWFEEQMEAERRKYS